MTDFADLIRRLESLIRPGTVASVRMEPPAVRVKSGGLLTDWLPWFSARAGTTREWNPPTPGEQCVVLSPSGDPACGFVLVGLYSDAAKAPSADGGLHLTDYPDGARISYNHRSGALIAEGVKTARIQASEFCQIDCPESEVTGNLTVKGDVQIDGQATVDGLFTYKSGMRGAGGAGGAGTSIAGTFTHTDGELSSNGIVLDSHSHDGVQPGGGSTGRPQ